MPWKEVNKMSLKREFVYLARQPESNISDLCRHFNISRTLAYRLLERYCKQGEDGLQERSRRPYSQPTKTPAGMEMIILSARDQHPSWGGRKLYHYLRHQGHQEIPHPNTITGILRRNGRLYEWRQEKPKLPYHRFERSEPNDLWQMDFKGHFPLYSGRCHPLTILDDHSRFSIALHACKDEKQETVKSCLIACFRQYGLPKQINVDNGPPWGEPSRRFLTQLALWIIRLGIKISYSRPQHPQTNGKDERFHRTLKTELLYYHSMKTLEESQRYFDSWRDEYNLLRPHESLQFDTPVMHYHPSKRIYPEVLPPIEYFPEDHVCKVSKNGSVSFNHQRIFVGGAFAGELVAVRPLNEENCYSIFYCQQKIGIIDLSKGAKPTKK